MAVSEIWQQVFLGMSGGLGCELLHWYSLSRKRGGAAQFSSHARLLGFDDRHDSSRRTDASALFERFRKRFAVLSPRRGDADSPAETRGGTDDCSSSGSR